MEKEKKEEEDDQRPAGLLSSQLRLRRSVYEVALHPGVPLHPAVLTWTRAHLPSRLGESPPRAAVRQLVQSLFYC